MYHTCCTDILCIQSIVSVLLENQYIPLEKQKHVSYQFTQMLLQQEFQRIRKREGEVGEGGMDHWERKKDKEVGKKESKEVNLRNRDGGWKEINNYKRLKESLGKRVDTEIEKLIQAIPWAKHIWAASFGQTHSFGRKRSSVAVLLMSAGA